MVGIKCRSMCCCYRRNGLNNSQKHAIKDTIKKFGVIFSDFDTTFSDLIAGMLLAHYYQRKIVQAHLDPTADLSKKVFFAIKLSACNEPLTPCRPVMTR